MKNKILTLSLCCAMICSLAACGGKTEEPKEAAGTNMSKQEEAKQTAEAETTQPEEEPEQVKLTADTIDKYFGFKYTDVADDAITGFTLKVDQAYGTETLNVNHVPMKYSESGCPSIDELAERFNNYAKPGVDPVGLYFDPFTELLSPSGKYCWAGDYGCRVHVNMDGNDASDYSGHIEETPELKWAIANGLTPVYLDPYMYGDKGQKIDNLYKKVDTLYAIMQPKSVMNALNRDDLHAGLLITNRASDFARVENGEITGLITSFASDKMNVTIADNITSESTIKDVVAKYAPSKGTITDNGSVTLTWNTASGTTTEITFSANEYKPTFVRILTPDMTPEIISGLGL